MGVKAFVDTNVLLRTVFTELNLHQECDALVKRLWQEDAELWISGQVIREFIVQATHPNTLQTPLTSEQAVEEVQKLIPLFEIADETVAVRKNLLDLLKLYPSRGKLVHDCNIVATMLASGIDMLLTINTGDFERYRDRITLLPP